METNEDGDRDWGAHVKGGDGALDKVRPEAVTLPWLLNTIISGEVYSVQCDDHQNCRVHQLGGGNQENYQQQLGCSHEAGCGGEVKYHF